MEEYLKQFGTEDLKKMQDELKHYKKYRKYNYKELYTHEEDEKIDTIQKILTNRVLTKKSKEMKNKKCTICKEVLEGFGNNAEPVKKGVCCDLCNGVYVIPARLKQIINLKK